MLDQRRGTLGDHHVGELVWQGVIYLHHTPRP